MGEGRLEQPSRFGFDTSPFAGSGMGVLRFLRKAEAWVRR